jgi:hypothetical protein
MSNRGIALNGQAGLPIIGGIMDVNRVLADLRQEQKQLGEAILALERLAAGGAKRRGRPPAWMAQLTEKRGPGRPPKSKNKSASPSAKVTVTETE